MNLEMTFKELIKMYSLKGKAVHSRIGKKYGERIKKRPNYMPSILARKE